MVWKLRRKRSVAGGNSALASSRKMGSRRSMGSGKTSVRNPRNTWTKQGHVFLAVIGLVSSSAIHNQTRGKRMCRGLRCVDAHAKQETMGLGRNGYSTSVKATNDCCCWVSRLIRNSTSARPKCAFIVTAQLLEDSPTVQSLLANSSKIIDILKSGLKVKIKTSSNTLQHWATMFPLLFLVSRAKLPPSQSSRTSSVVARFQSRSPAPLDKRAPRGISQPRGSVVVDSGISAVCGLADKSSTTASTPCTRLHVSSAAPRTTGEGPCCSFQWRADCSHGHRWDLTEPTATPRQLRERPRRKRWRHSKLATWRDSWRGRHAQVCQSWFGGDTLCVLGLGLALSQPWHRNVFAALIKSCGARAGRNISTSASFGRCRKFQCNRLIATRARRGSRSQDARRSFSDSGWPGSGICSSRSASSGASPPSSTSWCSRTSLIVPWSCCWAWSSSVPAKHTWAHRVKSWSSAIVPSKSANSIVSRSSTFRGTPGVRSCAQRRKFPSVSGQLRKKARSPLHNVGSILRSEHLWVSCVGNDDHRVVYVHVL